MALNAYLNLSMQFLRKMAQPYDKAGTGGNKTLLTQDDLQKMVEGHMHEMLYWRSQAIFRATSG